MSTHELKAVDFEFTNELQEGRNANQYFVVCVNQATEDDLQAYSDARENYGRSVSLVRLKLMSYYMYIFCIYAIYATGTKVIFYQFTDSKWSSRTTCYRMSRNDGFRCRIVDLRRRLKGRKNIC